MRHSNRNVRARGLAAVEIVLGLGLAGVLAMLGASELDVARRGARVAEAGRELERIGHASEAYRIDNNGYPASFAQSWLPPRSMAAASDWRLLSTPVQYLDAFPSDPFRNTDSIPTSQKVLLMYGVSSNGSHAIYPKTRWMAWSFGPDLVTQTGSYRSLATIVANESLNAPQLGGQTPVEFGGGGSVYDGMRYDPTNGLVSVGDIYRHSGS